MALNSLFTNKKFLRLARVLGISEPTALGHLEFLWHSTYANGDPNVGDYIDIEVAAKWDGESGAFAEVLESVGFIDKSGVKNEYVIHDWEEHSPPYVKRKLLRRKKDTVSGKQKDDNGRSLTDTNSSSCSPEGEGRGWDGMEKKGRGVKPPVEIPDEILDYTRRFNELVIEVREKAMDDLPGQSKSAMDIMRKRNHPMGEMEEILKYLIATKDDMKYSWMRKGQLTLKSMDGRIKDGTEWRSVYILNQSRFNKTASTQSGNPIKTKVAVELPKDEW